MKRTTNREQQILANLVYNEAIYSNNRIEEIHELELDGLKDEVKYYNELDKLFQKITGRTLNNAKH